MVVDDNVEFLRAARGLLERQGVALVGVASNRAEALRCVEECDPDVDLVAVVHVEALDGGTRISISNDGVGELSRRHGPNMNLR